jgi:hypothetical protein
MSIGVYFGLAFMTLCSACIVWAFIKFIKGLKKGKK